MNLDKRHIVSDAPMIILRPFAFAIKTFLTNGLNGFAPDLIFNYTIASPDLISGPIAQSTLTAILFSRLSSKEMPLVTVAPGSNFLHNHVQEDTSLNTRSMQNSRFSGNIHRIPAATVLPLFDSLFAVALTLLAYTVPDRLMSGMDFEKIAGTVGIYLLTGLTVILYWYKIRRLIVITRTLLPSQLLLTTISLLLMVMMPKFAQLVAIHGAGKGDLNNWTPAQIVNTSFIFLLACIDGICVAYGRSICQHPFTRESGNRSLHTLNRARLASFIALLSLGLLVLVSDQFNNEYVLLVPLILLLEEWWLGRSLESAK